MSKILELIDDFRLTQQVQERKSEYIILCSYRLRRWHDWLWHSSYVINGNEEYSDFRKIIHTLRRLTWSLWRYDFG